jgi:hypothetical protein
MNSAIISAKISRSEHFLKLSNDAALLFILMWPHCDDYGRIKASHTHWVINVCPGRFTTAQVKELQNEILANVDAKGEPMLVPYEVGGDEYYVVNKWFAWQSVRHNYTARALCPHPVIGILEPPVMGKVLTQAFGESLVDYNRMDAEVNRFLAGKKDPIDTKPTTAKVREIPSQNIAKSHNGSRERGDDSRENGADSRENDGYSRENSAASGQENAATGTKNPEADGPKRAGNTETFSDSRENGADSREKASDSSENTPSPAPSPSPSPSTPSTGARARDSGPRTLGNLALKEDFAPEPEPPPDKPNPYLRVVLGSYGIPERSPSAPTVSAQGPPGKLPKEDPDAKRAMLEEQARALKAGAV